MIIDQTIALETAMHKPKMLASFMSWLKNSVERAYLLNVRDKRREHEYYVCALTPELSRTAARNGGVVHVTMQPSREAVSA